MSKYSKNDPLVSLAAILLVAGVLGWMFVPEFRQWLEGLSNLHLFIGGMVVVAVWFFRYTMNYLRCRAQPSAVPKQTILPPPFIPPSPPLPLPDLPTETPVAIVSAPPAALQSRLTTVDLARLSRSADWFPFEKVISAIYKKLGYAITRRSGDRTVSGIDFLIEKDGQKEAIQCRQSKSRNIGVKAIREFVETLDNAGLKKGVFIALNGYTLDATQLAEQHGIKIVKDTDLAELLESADAGDNPEILKLLKDTAKYCPKCESEMVLKAAEKGPKPSPKVWVCSSSPKCPYTIQG